MDGGGQGPQLSLSCLMQVARDIRRLVEVNMMKGVEERMEVDMEESVESMEVDEKDDTEDMEVDEDSCEDMEVDEKDDTEDMEVDEKDEEEPMVLG